MYEKIDESVHTAELSNSREKLIGRVQKTDFSALYALRAKFNPYKELWDLASDFFSKKDDWLNTEIDLMSENELPIFIAESISKLKRMMKKVFKDDLAAREIAE